MRTSPKTVAYPDIPARGNSQSARRTWFILPFFVMGMIASLGIIAVAMRHGTVAAFLTIVAVAAAMVAIGIVLPRFFYRARSGAHSSSRWTWWHTLWFLVFASALVFRIRNVNQIDTNPLDAWALYRVALELIVGAVLFTRLALRHPPWLSSMFRGFLGALTVFSLVCLASSVWSVFPAWTFYKSCEYLLGLALLAAILETVSSSVTYESLFNWTWAFYGGLLVSAWLDVAIWPQLALYPSGFKIGVLGVRLTGVIPAVSADDVGVYAAILALVALCRLLPVDGEKRSRGWYLSLMTASVVTMVLSQTRAAIAGFLFGLFLLLAFSKRLRMGTALLLLLAPVLLITSVGGALWSYLERGENAQQISTLSSRLVWWSFAWHKFMHRPLLGFGAYAAGRFAVLAKIGMGDTSSLHSDLLGIIVGTGVWGLIPFLAALIGIWWFLTHYLRHSKTMGREQQLAYEAIAVLGVLSLNSLFLPMLTWQASLYFLVIVGYAEFLRRRHAEMSVLNHRPLKVLYREPSLHDAAL